ncbi:sensor histidine kinase [Aeromicrobium sp.]|uniref:sensor histidine kinase n=1 Tax=Aeromicrobium sp. TaxID=1871063 RepID=UPI003D6B4690
MRKLSSTWWDVAVAVVLTLATQLELVLAADRVEGSLLVQHVVFAVATACVALRRRAPLLGCLVFAVAFTLQTLEGEAPVVGGFLAMLILLVSLGFHATWRKGVVGVLAIAGAALSYDFLADEFVLADFLGNAGIVLMAWGLAVALRVATDRRIAAEVAKDRFAREEVAAERGRIARDLHDSVAHGLTLMTLQAGAARERATEESVVGALRLIEDGGRAALADMHRFLQLVGDDGDPGSAPGLQHLEEMVDRVRAGGLDVRLFLDRDLGGVAGGVSSTVYRIVQEALTNTVKHAGATHAEVSIAAEDGTLVVEVTDNGRARALNGSTAGSGRGVEGMRRRAELFDGTLTTGRTGDGGWSVMARLPLDGAGAR